MNIKSIIGWLISKILYEWNPFKARRQRIFYSQFINAGDLCFDVGAHLGDRTNTWLSIGAKVVAFEPQPKFANYLRDKFSANPYFSIEQKGVGDTVTTATLAISTMYPTLSTLAGRTWETEINQSTSLNVEFDQRVKVQVTTLDQMIIQYGNPKFCKIDVEGFEYEVLKGLTSPIPYLSFEFISFSKERMEACLSQLAELGYTKLNWSYRETFVFRFDEWVGSEQIVEDISGFEDGVYSGDIYACYG